MPTWHPIMPITWTWHHHLPDIMMDMTSSHTRYHGMTSHTRYHDHGMTSHTRYHDMTSRHTRYHGMTSHTRYHDMTYHHIPDIMAWHHIPDIMAWHHIRYHDIILIIRRYHHCRHISDKPPSHKKKIPDTMQQKHTNIQRVQPKGGSKMSFQVKTDGLCNFLHNYSSAFNI